MSIITIYTDGGARGNPGPAAAGVYSPQLGSFKKFLGVATNNQAEYQAILLAMQQAVAYQREHPEVTTLHFFMDSELAVKQLNREYKVKDHVLQQLFVQIWNLTTSFKSVIFTHVPRERNTAADRLVNEALDSSTKI